MIHDAHHPPLLSELNTDRISIASLLAALGQFPGLWAMSLSQRNASSDNPGHDIVWAARGYVLGDAMGPIRRFAECVHRMALQARLVSRSERVKQPLEEQGWTLTSKCGDDC